MAYNPTQNPAVLKHMQQTPVTTPTAIVQPKPIIKGSYQGGEAVPMVGTPEYAQALKSSRTQTTPINPEIIGKTKPINLAGASVDNTSLANGKLGATTAGAMTTVEAPAQKTEAQTNRETLQDKILGSIGLLSKKGERTEELQKEEGVFEKQKKSKELEGQYDKTKQSYDNQIEEVKLNKKGMSTQALNAEVNRLERQRDDHLSDIAIEYKVANGDYTSAVDIVNSKLDAEFQPIKDEIDSYTNLYNLMANDLSESEKLAVQEKINEKQTAAEQAFTLRRDEILHKYALSEKIAGGGGGIVGDNSPLYNGLTPATSTAVRGVVSGFKTEPQVTNFTAVQDGYNFATSLSETTTNPADDQALIYSLAKVLDPGSVVREGEYATAQKYAQSWVKAYGKKVTQAIAGTGFLSEEARKNIKNTIESKYNSSKITYDNLANQYATQINNLTGRGDGYKFLRDYTTSNTSSSTSSKVVPAQDVPVGYYQASDGLFYKK